MLSNSLQTNKVINHKNQKEYIFMKITYLLFDRFERRGRVQMKEGGAGGRGRKGIKRREGVKKGGNGVKREKKKQKLIKKKGKGSVRGV